jgi:hypothetical protein
MCWFFATAFTCFDTLFTPYMLVITYVDVHTCDLCISLHRIVKLVRAIRKGWLKVGKRRQRPQQQQPMYLLWGDDDQVGGE